ncbi:hypothetical protein [Streptomyces sp. SS]|uniref:hypothetical protein n=1 Tax=Streptomyces sp. SS TaxID=260742 RepID=UPI0002DC723C|nr:hypothetical protein [Streptomyces sp. SS]
MKHCAYCEKPILGTAVPVADDAGTGAHAPAYWHANKGECGPRVLRTSPRDDDRR